MVAREGGGNTGHRQQPPSFPLCTSSGWQSCGLRTEVGGSYPWTPPPLPPAAEEDPSPGCSTPGARLHCARCGLTVPISVGGCFYSLLQLAHPHLRTLLKEPRSSFRRAPPSFPPSPPPHPCAAAMVSPTSSCPDQRRTASGESPARCPTVCATGCPGESQHTGQVLT